MYQVKSLGVLPLAKMMAAIYGCMGLLFAPFLLLMGLVSAVAGPQRDQPPAAFFIVFAVLAPVFYAVLGFLAGLFGALIYNLFARWVGGIEMELQAVALSAPAAAPSMPGQPGT